MSAEMGHWATISQGPPELQQRLARPEGRSLLKVELNIESDPESALPTSL